MSNVIQSIRGTHDILPDECHRWQQVEALLRQLTSAYGYSEIRTPIMESTDLFCRSIGEVTDIVEKEMYTFADRNGDLLTLRPEGTASCVRAGIQHGLLHNQVQKLWYMGPMFRHERPQKGRYRQFHQFGVEACGIATPDIDAELIMMSARLWQMLGLQQISLELNTLGSSEARARYREVLVDYYQSRRAQLDEDSVRRLERNPLRILDSKNPAMQALNAAAPSLLEYLDADSVAQFDELKKILDAAGISYRVNPRLVRGLDYYCKTVFEWVSDQLGAQATVCAGGRYDGLVTQLGGRETPAIGFALGMERLLALYAASAATNPDTALDVYLLVQGEGNAARALLLAEQLRSNFPQLRLLTHCGGGSFKSQMKKADKSAARFAFILGESELAAETITIKPLRDNREPCTIAQTAVAEFIHTHIS